MSDNSKKKYQSSLVIMALELLIFSGSFLSIPYMFIVNRSVFRYVSYEKAVVESLIISIVLTVLFLIFRYTSVYIDEKNIIVRQGFKKHVFSIDDKYTIEKKRIVRTLPIDIKWLRISTASKSSAKRFRLYAFSDGTCEKIVNNICYAHSNSFPKGIKDSIIEHSWDDVNKFSIDKESIIKNERRALYKELLILVGISVFFVIFLLIEDIDFKRTLKMILGTIICTVVIIVELIKYKVNTSRCISDISFKGEHLMINDEHFMINDIEKLTIVHPKISSRSICPLQRYIKIKSFDGVHNYWAGSESSISDSDYNRIVKIVHTAFLSCPEKLNYVTKHSLMYK